MRRIISYCSFLQFKKLVKAPVEKVSGADKNNTMNISRYNLLWFKSKLNGKLFDILLDCGASTCCIARRCITSNKVLNSLPKSKYTGPGLIDVNGNALEVENVVRLIFTAGVPELSLEIDFVVVSQLPYSCIVGTNLLNMLHSWGVDNDSASLYLNSSVIKLYYYREKLKL